MAKELIINASLPEIRIALMEEGRIQELLIERSTEKGIVGNIYKGRVTRVLPGMQAAFVDVGLEKAAFLYVDDIYVHPKVMGDVEVEESHHHAHHDENEAPQKRPIIQPRQDPPKILETESASEADSEADVIDTSLLANRVADEVEAEFTSDEVANEFHDAALEQMAENLSEDTEEDEEDDENSDSNDHDSSEESDEEVSEELVAQEAQSSEEPTEGQVAGEEKTVEAAAEGSAENAGELQGLIQPGRKNQQSRFARGKGRRGGRGNNNPRHQGQNQNQNSEAALDTNLMPDSMSESLQDQGNVSSDRSSMEGASNQREGFHTKATGTRPEFREPRNRDRRVKSKNIRHRAPASIADLLQEGQEVIVQVAKDPIATKGARLTCHVSLPGRHLVCMPTIDHVGVSRRIERDDERRKLREYVERHRPRKMGFIVRTASGGKDPESWIKQDIDYLSKIWGEIRAKSDQVSAPSVVYEDLNSVLRAIRDWVNEDIGKIIVDSRYHYNELMQFAERFMPQLTEIIELYQGDIPIFDAYGISSELHRSLERKVWLKSGGYIVIDQAEALVAIDVNTGRYVGKKSLEDTIFKTNLEAAEEIAHQLRLRNCGGIIIVDFIDMEREDNRMRVYRALDEALKKDRARPTIQKISDLGLVEMTRKRTRDTIIRTLCEPCTHCEGKGFSKSTHTVAYEILREMERLGVDRDSKKILVSAHEQVIDILAIDYREIVDSLERRYNKQVYLQAVLDFHAEQFEVVTDRMQGKKQTQDIARQLRIERDRAERKEKTKQRQKENEDDRSQNDYSANSNDRSSEAYDSHAEEVAPRVPPAKKGPSPFIQTGKGTFTPRAQQPAPVVENVNAAGMIDDDAPPVEGNANRNQNRASFAPPANSPMHGMDDEDQLAYLRAQATQDAAIASLSAGSANVSPSVQRPQNNRNQNNHQRNNQGRNHNPRSQNNQNNQNRGNNRFRHQRGTQPNQGNSGGGIIQPMNSGSHNNAAEAPTAPPTVEVPQEIQVPDYEVLVKNNGES